MDGDYRKTFNVQDPGRNQGRSPLTCACSPEIKTIRRIYAMLGK